MLPGARAHGEPALGARATHDGEREDALDVDEAARARSALREALAAPVALEVQDPELALARDDEVGHSVAVEVAGRGERLPELVAVEEQSLEPRRSSR